DKAHRSAFLARELQQRGQLCLAYMATRANTADIFTKALQSGTPAEVVSGAVLLLVAATAPALTPTSRVLHLPSLP
ncbi:unnamed protein product, partial [Closterium sp. NIES-53]